MRLQIAALALVLTQVASFSFVAPSRDLLTRSLGMSSDDWQGEIVPNAGGAIRGCSVQQVGDSLTQWTLTIDG